jgi:hypothetical protein
VSAVQSEALLAPCRQLLDDRYFWEHQDQGLALFASPSSFRYYRLPFTPEEITRLHTRFYLKPILPLLTADSRFQLLALSQNHVRFFEGSRTEFHPKPIPRMPENFAAAFAESEFQNQLQLHTAVAGGDRSVVYHGTGEGRDDFKKRLLDFFRRIDQAVYDAVRDNPAPLVLAAVDYYLPIYQEATCNPHLLKHYIPGSPERLSDTDLHQRAWSIVDAHLRESQQRTLDRARELAATSRCSTSSVQIARAALEGRVDTLLAARGLQQWAAIDHTHARFDLHSDQQPGDEDLLDFAAIQTLLHRGTVHLVEPDLIPHHAPAIALLRY